MRALEIVAEWPVDNAASGVVGSGRERATHGDASRLFRWASITKLLTALAVLGAAEEGVLDLDDAAGPPGSTIRHLLAHASGDKHPRGLESLVLKEIDDRPDVSAIQHRIPADEADDRDPEVLVVER